MGQIDFMAKVEEYYTFDEMRDLMEDAKSTGKELETDMKLGASSLLLSIAGTMPMINKMVIENLTGLELTSDEAMYNYLTKSMNLTGLDIARFGLAQLSDVDTDAFRDVANKMMKSMER